MAKLIVLFAEVPFNVTTDDIGGIIYIPSRGKLSGLVKNTRTGICTRQSK